MDLRWQQLPSVERKQRSLYWPRNPRKRHCLMCHFIHLCHQQPVLHPCLQHQMGEAQGTITPVKFGPEALGGLNCPDLPESYGLQTHSKFASSHPTSPTQLGVLNQFQQGLLSSSDSHCSADAPEGSPRPNIL
jgi:hypothetical protein